MIKTISIASLVSIALWTTNLNAEVLAVEANSSIVTEEAPGLEVVPDLEVAPAVAVPLEIKEDLNITAPGILDEVVAQEIGEELNASLALPLSGEEVALEIGEELNASSPVGESGLDVPKEIVTEHNASHAVEVIAPTEESNVSLPVGKAAEAVVEAATPTALPLAEIAAGQEGLGVEAESGIVHAVQADVGAQLSLLEIDKASAENMQIIVKKDGEEFYKLELSNLARATGNRHYHDRLYRHTDTAEHSWENWENLYVDYLDNPAIVAVGAKVKVDMKNVLKEHYSDDLQYEVIKFDNHWNFLSTSVINPAQVGTENGAQAILNIAKNGTKHIQVIIDESGVDTYKIELADIDKLTGDRDYLNGFYVHDDVSQRSWENWKTLKREGLDAPLYVDINASDIKINVAKILDDKFKNYMQYTVLRFDENWHLIASDEVDASQGDTTQEEEGEAQEPETEQPEPQQPDANASKISGNVKDITNDSKPLAGATVSLYQGDTLLKSATTDASGVYAFDNTPSTHSYTVIVKKEGYLDSTYNSIQPIANETLNIETILEIDNAHAGDGSVKGVVSNAINGQGISGLTLKLRKGINTKTGEVVLSSTTTTDGAYAIATLASGLYTAEVTGEGFNAGYFTIVSVGTLATNNQNHALTPILGEGKLRVVLTWGEKPSDLDSHLTGPDAVSRFHIYYSKKGSENAAPFSFLDHDDVTSYGPETVTIIEQKEGVYRYSVHDFTNRGSNSSQKMANSSAKVEVYQGANLIRTFHVPQKDGTLWTVFELDGRNIKAINTVEYVSDEKDVRSISLENLEDK